MQQQKYSVDAKNRHKKYKQHLSANNKIEEKYIFCFFF